MLSVWDTASTERTLSRGPLISLSAALRYVSRVAAADYDDRGSGAPLVLLHPFPFSRRIWAGLADELAAHRRVITVDARGFGGTPLDGRYALTDVADDVAALLDRLNIPRATLLGMSMGGYTALAFAARHRKRLAALVLADTRAAADSAEARAGRATALERHPPRRARRRTSTSSLPRLLSPAAPPALVAHLRARAETRAASLVAGHRGAARPPRPIGRAGGDRLPGAGRVRRRRPGDAARRDAAGRRRDPGRALRVRRRGGPHRPRRGAEGAFSARAGAVSSRTADRNAKAGG